MNRKTGKTFAPSRTPPIARRAILAGIAAATLQAPRIRAEETASFGLTPVFLDSDIQLLAQMEAYLSLAIGRQVTLVKRRTYQEITALLVSGQLDAAWICGFPLVQHPDRLSVLAVPVYRGEPLYQSYLIAGASGAAQSLEELRGTVHAFSDPDSNSGFLVTRHLLARMGTSPEQFFSRSFFTYGHRNVVRAVAAGLAQSGSVDGYVWDVVGEIDRPMIERTRVVARSPKMGFPPVASNRVPRDPGLTRALGDALVNAHRSPIGREILATLRLDAFTASDYSLFASIAAAYDFVRRQT